MSISINLPDGFINAEFQHHYIIGFFSGIPQLHMSVFSDGTCPWWWSCTLGIPIKTKALQAPYGWRHASLGDLEKFLTSEAKAGRFKPQFEGGLDL